MNFELYKESHEPLSTKALANYPQSIHVIGLSSRWFPEIQHIYYQGNKRKLVPSNSNPTKLQSFFNCVAALMTSHLQSLALESMHDYTHLIAQHPVSATLPDTVLFTLVLMPWPLDTAPGCSPYTMARDTQDFPKRLTISLPS